MIDLNITGLCFTTGLCFNPIKLQSNMKNMLTFILCFFTITLQAQVLVSGQPDENKLSIGQILTEKDYNSNSKSTLKLLTEEVSVQIHDGKEVYKTIQNVEYTIQYKGTKISTKRKVYCTTKGSICPEGQAEKVFPDMTTNLLSSVLMPQTVKLEEQSAMLPFTINTDSDGMSSLYIDKLAVMKSRGKDTRIAQMGADLQLVQVSEELQYNQSDNKLYIDSLRRIQSVYSIVSKEKSGDTHKVEVRENIIIKDLIK